MKQLQNKNNMNHAAAMSEQAIKNLRLRERASSCLTVRPNVLMPPPER
jgi:hypothetical protein